ncbi:MAG TPA: M28 family peptidase [Gemmatimonadaceae bacterium]
MSNRILRSLLATTLLSVAASCTSAPRLLSTATHADSTVIRRDIEFLASDQLEGRLAGTPGNDSAAAYLARRYRSLGLTELLPGYLQPFDALSAQDAHMGRTAPRPTQNVVALLRGRDPALREEYVVIGAHFDHLGRSPVFALDPEAGDAIRNGADDNASGTAAVLDLARLLAANPPRRSVIFINFSAEELGVLGSSWFVNHPPVPLERIVAMLNFDMVGRLRNDKLIVYGTSTATELKGILDSANAAAPGGSPTFRISGGGDGYGPSDQSSFYAKDIPVLHFFTDLHEDYHRATDDADKINAGGEARVVDLALRVARAVADRPARLTFVRIAPPARTAVSEEGKQTYLGTIPDMGASDIKGLRLTGVRAGSPADLGGLKTGDVIVELGGAAVKDLYSYSDALYSHKPGDVVKIVVLRGGARLELSVTLGRRGG